MTTYLDDETYDRRRRRRIAALITVAAGLVVAADLTVAIQWATGARSASDAISTLLITAATVVAATWQFTHPVRFVCGPGYPVGACAAGGSMQHYNLPAPTDRHADRSPTTDEGEQ